MLLVAPVFVEGYFIEVFLVEVEENRFKYRATFSNPKDYTYFQSSLYTDKADAVDDVLFQAKKT